MSKRFVLCFSMLGALSAFAAVDGDTIYSGKLPIKAFALACSYITAKGTDLGERSYIIDPERQTVDGHPAKISANLISWEEVKGKKERNYMSIDRYTGDLHHRRAGGEVAAGKCVKMKQNRF